MDAKTKKTWISIVIAAVIIVGVLAVAVVGGTALFFFRHIDARVTAQENADRTFDQMRARFAGQQPLVEVTHGDDAVIHHAPDAPRRDIHALHALVYNRESGKLTRVDVPGWLLHLMSAGGRVRIANMDAFGDDDQTRLTLDDLERHGPGLVLDVKRGRGSQILIWTE
jgi:hypothetical protein